MLLIAKIAIRNIIRNKRRSILTLLTMLGCYTMLSLTLSISEGSYGMIIDLITSTSTGHIQLHKKTYLDDPSIHKQIPNYQKLLVELKDIGEISHATPRIHGSALAFTDKKATGVAIMGVDPSLEKAALKIVSRIKAGRYLKSEGEAMIGSRAARNLKIALGDDIFLISQATDGSIANDRFTVVGVIGKDNDAKDQSTVILSLKDAASYLATRGKVHEIVIQLDDRGKARAIARKLSQDLGPRGLEASPWQVVEAEFFHTMTKDKQGNDYFIVIIVIIVGLGVLNSVFMAVLERFREFGLMKAIGTPPHTLFLTIFAEIFLLALGSGLLGFFISYVMNVYLVKVGINMGTDIEVAGQVMNKLYGDISTTTLLTPAIIVIATALTVTIWPAIKAARTSPIDALRKT